MTHLKPGDIVRRSKGTSPMVILPPMLGDPPRALRAKYCGGLDENALELSNVYLKLVTDPIRELNSGWERRMSEAEFHQLRRQIAAGKNDQNTTPKEADMPKLYQTKEETPRFGTLLATNSAKKLVLEMKTSGEVLLFDKDEVEEVRPYTVRVRGADGDTSEYLSRKGDVVPDDVILMKGCFATIEAVDTKSDRATTELVGRKVMTVAFGEPVTE